MAIAAREKVTVHFQDLRFNTAGPTPGYLLQQSASSYEESIAMSMTKGRPGARHHREK
jgi:hypothetical protein